MSTEAGCARALFSLAREAAATCAIIIPEFNPGLGAEPGWQEKFGYDRILEALGVPPRPDAPASTPEQVRQTMIDILLDKLRVSIKPKTHVFAISVETEVPQKSAKIGGLDVSYFVEPGVGTSPPPMSTYALSPEECARLDVKPGSIDVQKFAGERLQWVTEKTVSQGMLHSAQTREVLAWREKGQDRLQVSTVPPDVVHDASDQRERSGRFFLREHAIHGVEGHASSFSLVTGDCSLLVSRVALNSTRSPPTTEATALYSAAAIAVTSPPATP